jgi:hypothetical protein
MHGQVIQRHDTLVITFFFEVEIEEFHKGLGKALALCLLLLPSISYLFH